ncbi:hypothetical protein SARC_11008 [Sphaeroforma arctica JP610]|uniref:Tyrosine-protein phosphatase domain-containing protein n=1 Tax=Sphaeroforma arctica JP610 TaxID=667725 RepID=A0A0L0FJ51_9EUKA|nr:hypothetical protein SARC_11008 [Sphaeroforma arctica JP610]KNC76496.1 hypothetical protein SARC_11008 [Sphaeroforma arctica JP610]|eukprot:XP_014150398.1 hypothetical protein SARC_11008 [Sphaeroforma arctica JP610]
MPWNGESSVCDQCLARNQGSVTAHRVQQGFSHISPLSSRVTQTPIELMEDKMYIGDVLSNRDLQQLHSHNVTVVIYFQTEPYNTPLYTQVQQMVTACGMEYNPVPSTAGVFQMYEYISEKITRGHKVAVYGVGQNDDHGAVVLLAFLMEFAGLTFHLARELLREKGILHPDAMNGDATERVDDLADAFAML